MKEKDCITIYETLEEHTNRCKYYFERIFYQKELDCVVRRFSEALEFKNKKAVYRWMIKLLWQMIIFHDIGKCNPNFQRKKMKNNDDSIPESLKGLSGTEHSFLSSILYLDYFFDLLEKEEAFDKLLSRIHPGAIVLLHNTSKTNGEILDELLSKWEEMGYHFAPLSELADKL